MSESSTQERESIFREHAHRLYLENRQKIVVLRLVQPKLFPWIWLLLAGLAGLVGLTGVAEVPVTLGGAGLLVESGPGDWSLIVSLPSEGLDRVLPEQRLLVFDAQESSSFEPLFVTRIDEVEPTLVSASALRQRFAIEPADPFLAGDPVVVAMARLGEGAPLQPWQSRPLRVEVEVDHQRVLSLLPGFGSRLDP
ncbi:MAG: hypothetical protein MPN21_13065 [Thermoanaerobaculia bacterium]|nr:hypothetical protein [Thermoanaerobaculia bacterium]